MKCPHCLNSFHDKKYEIKIDTDVDGGWAIYQCTCPECKRLVIELVNGIAKFDERGLWWLSQVKSTSLVHPKGASRSPLSKDVPEKYAVDYKEACLTLNDSPKASSALSRRCLQNLLRDEAKVKPGDLASEIQEVLDSGKLNFQLSLAIDAIRNIGNLAAHPTKNKSTGEIVDVEPGEAEWTLDVLESLFDFYFVQPNLIIKKREALNSKLAAAGKKPIK